MSDHRENATRADYFLIICVVVGSIIVAVDLYIRGGFNAAG